MKLAELIRGLRVDLRDLAAPYFWSNEELVYWLNEAQTEAAERGRLLLERSNPTVTRVALVAGQASYNLHKSLFELVNIHLLNRPDKQIHLHTAEWLDANRPGWRERANWLTQGPEFALLERGVLTLMPAPHRDGTLVVEGYRTPLAELQDDNDEPELDSKDHRFLMDWVQYRAFSVPDAEAFDPNRARAALERFTAHFGEHPGTNRRAWTREDEPHVTRPFWP